MRNVKRSRTETRAARKRVEAAMRKIVESQFSQAYTEMTMANVKEGWPIRCTIFGREYFKAMKKYLDECAPHLS